jgi:cleavage and polyadenylation specificity factor subunit 3
MTHPPDDLLKVTPLGAGNEVGRSCILLEYKSKTIMLDCGIHPAFGGLDALPFLDAIDPTKVDHLLVTHFHLDHAGAVPYFMCKTGFKGKVYMTHPTKAIYKWLLSDYVRVSTQDSNDDQLYDEQDLIASHNRITPIDYHQTIELEPGIRFTAYNAGHVLGAAMFLLEIAGVRILYTGDYSREEDRHLMAAEQPPGQVQVMICESTYGVQNHEPRVEREARFTRLVHDIVTRKGRCLIPTFALGRAQELLLILDEYWSLHPELNAIPVYYASALAKKCMAIYQTYVNMMNSRVRKQLASGQNPFVFKHISNIRGRDQFVDSGPCVMMASPGMLQNGFSRELLESWAEDSRNGLVVAGYVVEGTLGKTILSEPDEIPTMTGGKLKRRLSVHYVSFSAHVDFAQNAGFIDDVAPGHLILVHGEKNEMYRLRAALQSRYQDKEERAIHTPENCKTVELYFPGERLARTIGTLALNAPENLAHVSSLLVHHQFRYTLLAPEDLKEFTRLPMTQVEQTMQVATVGITNDLVIWALENVFGKLVDIETPESLAKLHSDAKTYLILDVVQVTLAKGLALLNWKSDTVGDMVADSVVGVLMGVGKHGGGRAGVKLTKGHHGHSHTHEEEGEQMEAMLDDVLQHHFGEEAVDASKKGWVIQVDDAKVMIDEAFNVSSTGNDELERRVKSIVTNVMNTVKPVEKAWTRETVDEKPLELEKLEQVNKLDKEEKEDVKLE